MSAGISLLRDAEVGKVGGMSGIFRSWSKEDKGITWKKSHQREDFPVYFSFSDGTRLDMIINRLRLVSGLISLIEVCRWHIPADRSNLGPLFESNSVSCLELFPHGCYSVRPRRENDSGGVKQWVAENTPKSSQNHGARRRAQCIRNNSGSNAAGLDAMTVVQFLAGRPFGRAADKYNKGD